MMLLIGLGNPGPRYAGNRHNIGFRIVDAVAQHHGLPAWRSRFQGLVTEGTLGGVKTLLLKPMTHMNLSGQAVGQAMRFYKLANTDLVVVHDELDLGVRKIRLKSGGGSAGNNGLRSLIQHIGADFSRLRIGIGHPGHKDLVSNHVLSDFAKADAAWVDPLVEATAANIGLLMSGDGVNFLNRVHLALPSDQDDAPKPKGRQLNGI
ncbi:MAG: aminoacyl-tRNA hydrolase [Alphaproteobacteria bacterium]